MSDNASKNSQIAKRRMILQVSRRLTGLYGTPKWRREGTALDTLIETVLSQNTNDRNSSEGFRRLKAAFPAWDAVAKSPWTRVAAAIRVSGLANIKSHRIQNILRRVKKEQGAYSIESLRRLPIADARDYLLSIDGVGPKTAACVLVFSFHKPVFPVDTHIHRVAKRLRLIGPKVGAAEAHEQLQKLVPDRLVYPLHIQIIRHGRDTCHPHKPECFRCVLRTICPSAYLGMSG